MTNEPITLPQLAERISKLYQELKKKGLL